MNATMEHAAKVLGAINPKDPILWASVAHMIFNPLFWNLAARNEFRRHSLTRLFGSARRGCLFLAAVIFSIGLSRDWLFSYAVTRQPKLELNIAPEIVKGVGYSFYAFGLTLVLASTYQLGIIGTYLGDYFGILLPAKVTGFPFNITNSPMYDGATINFIAHSILFRSPAGLALSLVAFIVYKIAITFEDSFTNYIYSNAAKKQAKRPGNTSTKGKKNK